MGSPAPKICRYAQQIEADLIVTATHGRTGLRHIVMGSTAEQIVRYARSPVLVVPSREKGGRMKSAPAVVRRTARRDSQVVRPGERINCGPVLHCMARIRLQLPPQGQPQMGHSFFTESISTVVENLATDPKRGLTTSEAQTRLARVGPNKLAETVPPPLVAEPARAVQSARHLDPDCSHDSLRRARRLAGGGRDFCHRAAQRAARILAGTEGGGSALFPAETLLAERKSLARRSPPQHRRAGIGARRCR